MIQFDPVRGTALAQRLLQALLLILLLLLPMPTLAQGSAAIDEIVKSAKDNGVQVIVVNPNGTTTMAEPQAPGARVEESFMMRTQHRLLAFRVTLRERLNFAPASVEEVLFILNGQSPTGHWSEYVRILAWTLVLLIASELIVQQTFERFIVWPWFRQMQTRHPVGYTGKLPILLLRAILALLRLAMVTILSYILGLIIFGEATDGTVRLTVAYIYASYITARAIVFLWRMILSPYLEPYRIPSISNEDARRLYWWLLTIACVAVAVINFCNWLQELGISYNVHSIISSVLTFGVVLMNIAMVIVNRRGITGIILNGRPVDQASVPAKFAARAWLPAVILYFLVAWAEMTYRLIEELPLGQPLITGFYFILLSVLVVYGIVGYLIERIFRRRVLLEEMRVMRQENAAQADDDTTATAETPPPDEPAAEPEAEPNFFNTSKLRSFEDLSRRVANLLAVFVGLYAIAAIWRIDIGMTPSDLFPQFYDVLAILFIGYVLYHAARIWIDQKIIEEGGDAIEVAPGDEGGAGGASRLATLLPLFRNFLLVVIVFAVGMIALTNLGINVSAIFAGAGIVGIAIGFGAQTLVRDIFSGAFFLFDDAFRKGEYIDVGDVKGTVEKISVRSFQLRHHLGPLHTIPFGEIQHLTNFSRDWVMMKLPLRVTYDTDVERVRKLIKKLGEQLAEDPLIGHQFLQPLKSQGVIEMQDSAMIIRVKFMTRPGDQWVLRKRVYQEIRDLFEREGIKFAHREVTVRIAGADPANLTDRQKEAIGAAALSSMDEDDIAEAMSNDGGDDR